MLSEPEIAAIIPCLNEDASIAKVIRDFRQHMPHAKIYMFDNDSADNTAAIASAEGIPTLGDRYGAVYGEMHSQR